MSESAKSGVRSEAVCEPCQEYRRGERENLSFWGIRIHVCERKRGGVWGWQSCPCGCPSDITALPSDE